MEMQKNDIMSLPCHIIWTTRTDFSSWGFETVLVGPFQEIETLVVLYEKIDRAHKEEAEQEAIRKIIELLEYHTFAVSLTAAQAKAAHMKPTQMYQKLSTEGLEIQTSSGFVRDKKDRRKMTASVYIC